MLQIAGRLLLFCGVSALGLAFARDLRCRASCLRAFSQALDCLARELGFALPPLALLLARMQEAGGPATADFFTSCRAHFATRSEQRFAEIWLACLHRGPAALSTEDRQLLAQLGEILGRYDAQSQREGIDQLRSQVANAQTEAAAQAARLGRVYVVAALCLALFLVLLL